MLARDSFTLVASIIGADVKRRELSSRIGAVFGADFAIRLNESLSLHVDENLLLFWAVRAPWLADHDDFDLLLGLP